MPNPELVSYLQEQTQQGVSAQVLRESLMEAGWHEMDIENALHDVAAGLHPATPGASIHEDLAQVRGMVAHLAARVGNIEAMLPSSFIGPDHELPAPTSHSLFWRVCSLIATVALTIWLGTFFTQLIAGYSITRVDLAIILGAGSVLLFVIAIMFVRHNCTWNASLMTAYAVTSGAAGVWLAWKAQSIEWTVALALGAFLFAILWVMAMWIRRYKAS